MSNEITFEHPATPEQLEHVWQHLRPLSRLEADGLGYCLDVFRRVHANDTCALLDGVPAGVFGARVHLNRIEFVFFVTDAADSHPSLWRRTTKIARWFVREVMREYPGRPGITCDTDENEDAIRWNAVVGFRPNGKSLDLPNGARFVFMERPAEPDQLALLGRVRPAFVPPTD